MKINVQISKLFPEGEKLKAIMNVTLDNSYAVHGIRIFNSNDNHLIVTMPRQKTASGDYKDVFHPINKEAREEIINEIFKEYDKAIGNQH